MKLLKKALSALAVIFAVVCAAGCNNKTYELYTNMPDGYELLDKSFKTNLIDGYVPTERGGEAPDSTGYTTKGITYFSMYTDATIAVSDDFKEDTDKEKFADFTTEEGKKFISFTQAVKQQLDDIDKALSTSVINSDVSKFNAADAGEKVQISKTAYEVISEAKRIYEMTEGYYNPALYYNVLAYGFGDNHRVMTKEELPSDEIIATYTDLASHFEEVQLIQEGETHYVVKPEYTVVVEDETLTLHIDLSGIGKGYAVDKVEKLFNDYGYEFGYFSFGSSSMLVKRHLDGAYNLGLSNPRSPSRDTYVKTAILNEKLSTSGDNEQFYVIDGVRYCHVIDPTTGKPVQTGIMSATVIGGSAAEDDALTTAIMAMGKEKAISFVKEKLNDRRVVFTCE
ncbi:MAG: FAD:protein FMN transferase [Clostridia bacterium]|nr:FAD:protein FMN transferase [Clostridia bacterium]